MAETERKWILMIEVMTNKKSVYLKFRHVYYLIFRKSFVASFKEASYHSIKTVWWFEYKYNTNRLKWVSTFKRLARIRRKRENRVFHRTPREREKDPRSATRLRPSDSKQRKKLLGHVPATQIDGTAPVNFFFFHFSNLGMKCYF